MLLIIIARWCWQYHLDLSRTSLRQMLSSCTAEHSARLSAKLEPPSTMPTTKVATNTTDSLKLLLIVSSITNVTKLAWVNAKTANARVPQGCSVAISPTPGVPTTLWTCTFTKKGEMEQIGGALGSNWRHGSTSTSTSRRRRPLSWSSALVTYTILVLWDSGALVSYIALIICYSGPKHQGQATRLSESQELWWPAQFWCFGTLASGALVTFAVLLFWLLGTRGRILESPVVWWPIQFWPLWC